jgi:hypothetical protein
MLSACSAVSACLRKRNYFSRRAVHEQVSSPRVLSDFGVAEAFVGYLLLKLSGVNTSSKPTHL